MFTFDTISRIALDEATEFLIHHLPFINTVDIVIQLGSGQTAENILDDEWDRLSLRNMPHLPTTDSLAKHRLEILWGTVGEFKVLVYSGRFHLYEGYGRVPCILPIWVAAACGARNFVFANAAVALGETIQPGNFMIFTDHINNQGISAIAGHQHLLDSPYVDMSDIYNSALSASFIQAARREGMTLHQGVYMANVGPQYETPAELRLARSSGADAIGMSTVLEATTAHALRGRVVGISMIKHAVSGPSSAKLSHQEAFEVGKAGNTLLVSATRRWLHNEAKGVL